MQKCEVSEHAGFGIPVWEEEQWKGGKGFIPDVHRFLNTAQHSPSRNVFLLVESEELFQFWIIKSGILESFGLTELRIFLS